MQKQGKNYFVIGLFCVTIDWLFFCFEIYILKLEPIMANLISSHIGIFLSFYLNCKYNFSINNSIIYRFISFYMVGLIGYIFGHLFLEIGLSISSFRSEVIKAFSYIGIFYLQFTLNKLITFGSAWKDFRLYILKYLARNNMLGLGFDLSKERGAIELISDSLGGMELFFQFVFIIVLSSYILIANFFNIFSLGYFGTNKSFLIFSKLIPFKFAIRWLRSYSLMVYGEIVESN